MTWSDVSSDGSLLSPPASPTLDVVTLKKRYRISKRHVLGEGGFAKVHKGLDKKTNTNVAVKMYSSSDADAFDHFQRTIKVWQTITDQAEKSINGAYDVEQQKQFIRQHSFDESYILKELKATLSLDEALTFNEFIQCLDIRRCFVQLLDYSTDEDGQPGFDPESNSLWIVQEMGLASLDEELTSRADQQPMDGAELLHLLWSLVCITWGLHVCGFVHMDIKPTNIIKFSVPSEDDGDESPKSPKSRRSNVQWKLIDLDGALKANEEVQVGSDKLVFTPIFMPPELAGVMVAKQSSVTASRLMDVWSIGLCVMQAIFHVPVLEPFYLEWNEETGDDGKFLCWLADFKGEPIIHGDMERHIRQIDPGLCMLLKKMLVRDSSQRFCTARCLMHVAFKKKRRMLMQKDDAIQAWMTEAKSEQQSKHPSSIFISGGKGEIPQQSRSNACAVM